MRTLLYTVIITTLWTGPQFDVATVKDHKGPPGARDSNASYGRQGINFRGLTLGFIIAEAYGIPAGQIELPDSVSKEIRFGAFGDGFDIVANADHPVSRTELRIMLRSLLEDRFKLTLRKDARTTQVYKLMLAKDGTKLEESKDGGDLAMSNSEEGYVFRNAEVIRLCGYLSSQVDRIVVDETGLKGVYNFTLKKPEEAERERKVAGIHAIPPAAYAEALKKLGLRLVADKAAVEFSIVDHVERPAAN